MTNSCLKTSGAHWCRAQTTGPNCTQVWQRSKIQLSSAWAELLESLTWLFIIVITLMFNWNRKLKKIHHFWPVSMIGGGPRLPAVGEKQEGKVDDMMETDTWCCRRFARSERYYLKKIRKKKTMPRLILIPGSNRSHRGRHSSQGGHSKDLSK